MNPISTFEPTVGAHVHDVLNNIWMTLTADDVDEMQRELRELVGETGPLKIGTASFWMRATFGTTWRLLAAQPSYYRSAVFFSPRFHEPCRRVGAQWGT
jgi:hypothetical protein